MRSGWADDRADRGTVLIGLGTNGIPPRGRPESLDACQHVQAAINDRVPHDVAGALDRDVRLAHEI